MSKENHTPEPWHVANVPDSMGRHAGRYEIFNKPYQLGIVAHADSKEDSDRIVSCVNAMKGIEDPAKYVTDNNDLKDLLRTLVEVSKNTETISTKSLVFEALVHAMQKDEK